MNLETKLTLDLLAESKQASYQKRYEVVNRFIETYGIIPSFNRIIKNLPKSEEIIRNVCVPEDLAVQIEKYEKLLELDPTNPGTINELDKLYDINYRQTKSTK